MRILVIRFSSFGDCALLCPTLVALQKSHPGAQIDLLTSPAMAPLFEALPFLHRVLRAPLQAPWRAKLSFLKQLKQTPYDIWYDAHASLRSRFTTLVAAPKTTRILQLRKHRIRRFFALTFKIKKLLPSLPFHSQLAFPLSF